MPRNTIHADATMHARSEVVWDILTDYQSDHPKILPKGFSSLQVEQGGKGAGTVIHFSVRVMGMTQEYRGEVSVPEPGRVLVESYTTGGTVTTFSVTPVENESGTHVRISTEMDARPGLPGAIERVLTRLVMGRMYREELGKLAVLAESRDEATQRAQ